MHRHSYRQNPAQRGTAAAQRGTYQTESVAAVVRAMM